MSVLEPSADADIPGLANLLLAARTAWGVVRRSDVQVVHCHTLHLQSLVAGLVARALGKAVIVTIHGPSPPTRRAAILFRAVERICIRVPHRIVVVAACLEGEYERHSVVIPNGVQYLAIHSARNRRDGVRASLGVHGEAVVAYVGRITVDKGIAILGDAIQRLRESQGIKIHLLAVGPVAKEFLPESISHDRPWTHWVGPVDDPIPFLAAADVFALPSLREGMPLSLLEAMAAGLPVVASAVGGVPEVVKNESTGLLVPPGDVEALETALHRLLKDPELSSRLGRGAADVVAEQFDLGLTVRRYRALYEEVLHG